MSELRKCVVKRPYEDPVDATFHQWGTISVYGDGETSYPVTIAIVELPGGQISQVPPDQIKLL